jgi:hypothetical protein
MQNIHGPHEWVSVQDMSRAVEACVKLTELWATLGKDAPAGARSEERRAQAEPAPVDWAG